MYSKIVILEHLDETIFSLRVVQVDTVDSLLVPRLALDQEALALDELGQELLVGGRGRQLERATNGEAFREAIDQIGRDLTQVFERHHVRIAVVNEKHLDLQLVMQGLYVFQVVARERDYSRSKKLPVKWRYARFSDLQ